MLKQALYYLMPIIKVLLFAVFIYLCGIPFSLIYSFNLIPDSVDPLLLTLIDQTVQVLIVFGGLLMVFRIFSNYSFESITIVRKSVWPAFAKGTLIGFATILICGGLAMIFGNVAFTMGKFSLFLFVGYFVLYVLVAIFEEVLFRTFPLIALAERYRVFAAILISSVLFGLAHLANPGFTWLAMLNITLAGILFSIYVLQKRNVYWAIGIHFGWNFTQGVLLGYKVSGTDANGILSAKPIGNVYLSGGNFGIESSIYCTMVILILIVYCLVKYKIEPVNEIVFEEEFEEIETT